MWIDFVDYSSKARDKPLDQVCIAQVIAANMDIPQYGMPMDNVEQFLNRGQVFGPAKFSFVIQPGGEDDRYIRIPGCNRLEYCAEQFGIILANEAGSVGKERAFFVTNLEMTNSKGGQMSIRGPARSPGGIHSSVQVFHQVGGVCGTLGWADGWNAQKTGCYAEGREIGDAETVGVIGIKRAGRGPSVFFQR